MLRMMVAVPLLLLPCAGVAAAQPGRGIAPVIGHAAYGPLLPIQAVMPPPAPVVLPRAPELTLAPLQPPPPTAASAPPPTADRETVFWQSVIANGARADFEAYLQAFPNGTYAPLARSRLAALAPPKPSPANPPMPLIDREEAERGRAEAERRTREAEVRRRLEDAQGLWTTGTVGQCQIRFYQWQMIGNQIEFRDHLNQVDREEIIAISPEGFDTRTVFSNHRGLPVAINTAWEYRFLDNGGVRVRNVANGASFTLTRCPTPAR